MRRRVIGAMALSAVVGLGIAACGSSSSPTGSDTAATAVSGGPCDVQVSTDTSVKPTVNVPTCAQKPTTLVMRDIVAGTGSAAKAGDSVSVKYDGISWSTKQQFDASWDNGLGQFTVAPLGQAQVIDGWNQGLIGVKTGARRLLIIPPNLGYGAQANGPIAANETLIFVVDVISIS